MIDAARLALVAVLVFVVDQATKLAVVEAMNLRELQRIDLFPGFASFQMAWNRGVNFGLFASGSDAARWFLTGLAVAVSIAVAIWALRRGTTTFIVGGGLLIGGALGNALDRVRYGAVADFLNITCCGVRNPYAFNVADVAIFAGALALALAPSGSGAEAEGRR